MSKAPPSTLAIHSPALPPLPPSGAAGEAGGAGAAVRARTVIARLGALPRRLLLGLVTLYQRTLSPAMPAIFGPACGCRFYPTCSHYASEALRVHGALRGTWLTLVRLLKCTPLHPGGIDPVPPLYAHLTRRATRPTCSRTSTSTACATRVPTTGAQRNVAGRADLPTPASVRPSLSL